MLGLNLQSILKGFNKVQKDLEKLIDKNNKEQELKLGEIKLMEDKVAELTTESAQASVVRDNINNLLNNNT